MKYTGHLSRAVSHNFLNSPLFHIFARCFWLKKRRDLFYEDFVHLTSGKNPIKKFNVLIESIRGETVFFFFTSTTFKIKNFFSSAMHFLSAWFFEKRTSSLSSDKNLKPFWVITTKSPNTRASHVLCLFILQAVAFLFFFIKNGEAIVLSFIL